MGLLTKYFVRSSIAYLQYNISEFGRCTDVAYGLDSKAIDGKLSDKLTDLVGASYRESSKKWFRVDYIKELYPIC